MYTNLNIKVKLPKLPDHLTDIPGKDSFLGFDEQDEGLSCDVQVDLGVMAAVAVLACLPMLDVGIHLRKLPQGIDEAGNQLSFGQGGFKHYGAEISFAVQ